MFGWSGDIVSKMADEISRNLAAIQGLDATMEREDKRRSRNPSSEQIMLMMNAPIVTAQDVNTMVPEQYGRRLADDISKLISLNDNAQEFVPKGTTDSKAAVVQVMAWRYQVHHTVRWRRKYNYVSRMWDSPIKGDASLNRLLYTIHTNTPILHITRGVCCGRIL